MLMRKLITPILLLLTSVAIAVTPKYLIVHSNGQVKPYSISNIRKVTFSQQTSNSLEIHQKGVDNIDKYNYSNLENVIFDIDPTSVENVQIDSKNLSISYNSNNQEVQITSTQEISIVIVCNTNGKIIEMATPFTNEAYVSMANYTPGIYIVKALSTTASNTQKIIKH